MEMQYNQYISLCEPVSLGSPLAPRAKGIAPGQQIHNQFADSQGQFSASVTTDGTRTQQERGLPMMRGCGIMAEACNMM